MSTTSHVLADADRLRGALRVVASYSGSDAGDAAIKEVVGMFEELQAQLLATQQDRVQAHARAAREDQATLAALAELDEARAERKDALALVANRDRLLDAALMERDSLRALASEWERLRNDAYAKYRKAGDERDELRSALEELVDLMDGVRSGDYTPDSFTTQTARVAKLEAALRKVLDRAVQESGRCPFCREPDMYDDPNIRCCALRSEILAVNAPPRKDD